MSCIIVSLQAISYTRWEKKPGLHHKSLAHPTRQWVPPPMADPPASEIEHLQKSIRTLGEPARLSDIDAI